MKILTAIIAAAAVFGASAAASAAHHRGHIYRYGYASGPYGGYASSRYDYASSPYGSYASSRPFESYGCHHDVGQRPEIAIQDRFYDQSQGKNC